MKISENREMYLLSIANFFEGGGKGPVPLHFIADELDIMPVSVNEMIRKLSKEGFVRYFPYKGVELLPKGKRVAQNVLRRRRLWEVFLVEQLGLTSPEADSLACRLEHVTPASVADSLHEYLGRPTKSPQGKPIPPSEALTPAVQTRLLANLGVDEEAEVVRIGAEAAALTFLGESGILPGARIKVIALGSRGDMLLEVMDGQAHIGSDLAGLIFVADKARQLESR